LEMAGRSGLKVGTAVGKWVADPGGQLLRLDVRVADFSRPDGTGRLPEGRRRRVGLRDKRI
jgi:hypothetical protein